MNNDYKEMSVTGTKPAWHSSGEVRWEGKLSPTNQSINLSSIYLSIFLFIVFFAEQVAEILGPDFIGHAFRMCDRTRVELRDVRAVVHDEVPVVLVLFDRVPV
jgi:hypothetical protein